MQATPVEQIATVRESSTYGEIVHVFGDVDFSTASILDTAIVEAAEDGRAMFINLTTCRYIDSSGLTALVRAQRRHGPITLIVAPGSLVERVMRLSSFNRICAVVSQLPTSYAG